MELVTCPPQQLQQHHHQKPMEQKNSKIRVRKTLDLESYLAFLSSQDLQSLKCDQLCQIMSIYGFKKARNRKEAEEALPKIKPLDLVARSTLNENVSSQAFVKLDEAIKDLASLNWQECSVTSIKSFNSLNYFAPFSVPPTEATTPKTPKEKQTLTQTMPTTSLGSSSSGPTKNASQEAGSSFSTAAKGSGNGGNGLLRLKKKRKTPLK